MNRMYPRALLATILSTAPLAAQSADGIDTQTPRPFTVDDAINMTSVSNPRLSPDGTRVLFARRTLDWAENERNSRLWIVNSDGTDARPFTSEPGDGSASWSPDGRWIAFTRRAETEGGDDETRQIFLIRADGGEARQLTEHVTSIEDYAWGPSGRRIFFVAEDSLSDSRKEALENGADAFLVDEGPNGQGPGRWSNLWVVPAHPDSGAARPLTEGDRIVDDLAVGPAGRRVAFTFRTEDHRNDSFRSEIAVVDIASGVITVLTENAAPEGRLAWSPDGNTLTFMAPDLESWRLDEGNLYAMELESGKIRQLAAGFGPGIGSYEWAPDGRHIDFVALDRTVSNLYRLAVGEDEIMRLSELDGVVGDVDFSSDHGRVAYAFETPTSPRQLYASEYPDLDAVRITNANPWMDSRTLVRPEVVRWTSDDGLEIEGLLYLPPGGGDDPGAFVLDIHGGPAGVFTRSFSEEMQVLTAYGYAVLQPNVRGSSGYGDAFLRGNMNDIGGGDYHDLMTGVDAMIRRGLAHPDSLAVRGWSYGGILGSWTITQTDRFQAASLGAMVADWRSEFGAGFNYDVVRWYIGGTPWTNAEEWLARSSYTHLDQVTTPTILFHGEDDRTDTVQQTMNFHEGLRSMGVPVRFVRFPREGHGIREPRHERRLIIEELRWFQRYVRGDEDWQPPARPDSAGKAVTAAAFTSGGTATAAGMLFSFMAGAR